MGGAKCMMALKWPNFATGGKIDVVVKIVQSIDFYESTKISIIRI